jgi:uncharacterized protein (DUF362 family)
MGICKVFISKVTMAYEKELQQALAYIEWEKVVASGARVFLKPNLTYPTPKPGVTTTPKFIEAAIQIFSQRTSNLIVGESDGGYRGWPAEMAFHSHGLPEVCRRYGARLVNLSKVPRKTVEIKFREEIRKLNLPSLLLDEIDVLVPLAVPKIHQVTVMSGAIKNQWGCIPDNMRLINHPYFDEIILEINRLVRTRMALADGTFFLNRTGPMQGDPARMDLLIASDNIGALDRTLCQIMGLDITRVRYLSFACQKGWIPLTDQIKYNVQPSIFYSQQFYLKRTLRNRIVSWAFYRPWAINLFWISWFAGLLRIFLYAIAGNPVRKDIRRLHDRFPNLPSFYK